MHICCCGLKLVCTVQSNQCFVLHLNGFCHLPNNDKHWTLDLSYMLYIKTYYSKPLSTAIERTAILNNAGIRTAAVLIEGNESVLLNRLKWWWGGRSWDILLLLCFLLHTSSSCWQCCAGSASDKLSAFGRPAFTSPHCSKGKMFCFYRLLWNTYNLL